MYDIFSDNLSYMILMSFVSIFFLENTNILSNLLQTCFISFRFNIEYAVVTKIVFACLSFIF